MEAFNVEALPHWEAVDTVSQPNQGGVQNGLAAAGQSLASCPAAARYMPTPQHVVEAMLAMAQVARRDVVYDPGCGDGRMVITAARRYGARGVGIDIDPWCIEQSRRNARSAGVEQRVMFIHGDAMLVDLSPATVVTLYMPARWNAQFLPKLRSELAPGARVVAYMYDFGTWAAAETQLVTDQYGRRSPIYLWCIGAG